MKTLENIVRARFSPAAVRLRLANTFGEAAGERIKKVRKNTAGPRLDLGRQRHARKQPSRKRTGLGIRNCHPPGMIGAAVAAREWCARTAAGEAFLANRQQPAEHDAIALIRKGIHLQLHLGSRDNLADVARWNRYFGNHLDGQRCQPFTADIYVRIPSGNRRQADMGIDCGTPDDDSMEADTPILVLEILSPTTRVFDRNDKLEEYRTVETLEYIVLVDPDQPQIRVYRRQADRSWSSERLAGLTAVLDLPLLDFRVPLSSLYAGLSFRPRPTLVGPEGDPAATFEI